MTTHRHEHGDETPADHTAKIVGTSAVEHLGGPALTIQQRDLIDARVFIDRKLSEGKTRLEARRAHKRH